MVILHRVIPTGRQLFDTCSFRPYLFHMKLPLLSVITTVVDAIMSTPRISVSFETLSGTDPEILQGRYITDTVRSTMYIDMGGGGGEGGRGGGT